MTAASNGVLVWAEVLLHRPKWEIRYSFAIKGQRWLYVNVIMSDLFFFFLSFPFEFSLFSSL